MREGFWRPHSQFLGGNFIQNVIHSSVLGKEGEEYKQHVGHKYLVANRDQHCLANRTITALCFISLTFRVINEYVQLMGGFCPILLNKDRKCSRLHLWIMIHNLKCNMRTVKAWTYACVALSLCFEHRLQVSICWCDRWGT